MKIKFLLPFLLLLLLTGCNTNPVKEKIEEAQAEAQAEQPDRMPAAGEPAAPKKKMGDEMTVHYINAGQADATLLMFADGEQEYRVLVDAGNWNSSDVVRYLQGQFVDHLDIVIGTHPHAGHIGQIDQLIEQIGVDEVWLSGDTANSKVFSRLLDAIEKYDVGYEEPRAGDVFDVGPLTIEVFNPNEVNGNAHEGSLSMKMTYGDVSFLFTGDAGVETERRMIDHGYDLQADFLQLGHHGSRTSTSLPFLEAVNPEVAIISAGKDSQYGHPHEEVVSRVVSQGIELYQTAINGSIVVQTDGETYTIGAVKDQAGLADGNCIDINEASIEELQSIVHIGPERAQMLMDLRPFERIEDLEQIDGIGPGLLADILAEGAACTGG